MLASLGFGYWDDWELQSKVTFDGVNKLITVNPDVTNVDIRTDVWTRYVDWLALRDNTKYGLGMRFVGFDPVPDGKGGFKEAGAIFFMTNGWKFIVDLTETAISGVLTSDDFPSAYFSPTGKQVFPAQVSAIVNTATTVENVITGTALTEEQTASAVWQAQQAVDLIEEVHYIERAVHIDTEAITQGIGTQANPFNTLEAALDFAELNGYKLLHVLSDITIDRNLKNFVVSGIGIPAIDCNGHNLDRSRFDHCTMKGTYTGFITVQDSLLFTSFSVIGYFENCSLNGIVNAVSGETFSLIKCQSAVKGLGYPVINGMDTSSEVRGFIGSLGVTNTTAGTHSVGLTEGRFLADNTNAGGQVHVRGLPFEILDTSAVGFEVIKATEAKAIWDEVL